MADGQIGHLGRDAKFAMAIAEREPKSDEESATIRNLSAARIAEVQLEKRNIAMLHVPTSHIFSQTHAIHNPRKISIMIKKVKILRVSPPFGKMAGLEYRSSEGPVKWSFWM